ncbi:hypothetical protein Tco_0135713, partial [Tanacetum coccineum]
MVYLKNMAGYKMGYFQGMGYDDIKPIFEEVYNKVQTLFKKDTEVDKSKKKMVAEETLLQESFKKLRTVEASRPEHIEEQPTKEPEELSEEELKKISLSKSTSDKEKVLWVELKRLFEPDDDDTLWKLQRYMHDPLTWKLYDTCGVHHVSTERGHDIF